MTVECHTAGGSGSSLTLVVPIRLAVSAHLVQPRPTGWQTWPVRLEPDALNEIDLDTPFLATDCGEVAARFDAFVQAMQGIRPYFALKCNAAQPVLATLAERGAGFEIAS